jgi:hypothetical protein
MPESWSIPVAAALGFLAFSACVGAGVGVRVRNAWWLPAAGSLAFLLFSLHAVAAGGPFGFWTEHTRNAWGHQIWLDLLLAIAVAWSFVVPRAKALGMRPAPWLALVVCTGCIGLLAMTARLLYLRDRVERT